MKAYRVSPCKHIKDLSGTGAALHGGRWNSKGVYILYASVTPSLAMLEVVVHLSAIPKTDYCLAVLEVPNDKIDELKEKDLPDNWREYPGPDALKKIGDRFIAEGKHLGLLIPSAVMKEENNLFLNPRHPDFRKVRLLSAEKTSIDVRLITK